MSGERFVAESLQIFHGTRETRETPPWMRHRSLHAPRSTKSALGKASAAAPHVTTSPRHHVVPMCQMHAHRNCYFETLRKTKSESKERSSVSLLCVPSTWNCCILGWDVQLDSQGPERNSSRRRVAICQTVYRMDLILTQYTCLRPICRIPGLVLHKTLLLESFDVFYIFLHLSTSFWFCPSYSET